MYLEEEIKLFVRLTWQIKLETYDISTRMILFLRSKGSFRLSQKRSRRRKRSKRSAVDRCEWTLTVADLRGTPPSYVPLYGRKFSQFHAGFWKIWQNRILAPPREGRRPLLRGDPGSTPA